MKILIDNGHGSNTPGKCSPDKTLREYAWTREITAIVVNELKRKGLDASLLVPELQDISLTERVARINKQCSIWGSKNVVLVSIHNNAARSDGQWDPSARGFSVFVSKTSSEKSKDLSEIFYSLASDRKMLGNRSTPKPDGKGRHYWTWSWTSKDIYILTKSNCPAVLTENLFMDNKQDCAYLLSEDGKAEIVKLHVDAITNYVAR